MASLRKGVSGMVLVLSSALSALPAEASSFWSAMSPASFCRAVRFFFSSARSLPSSGLIFHSSYRFAVSCCCDRLHRGFEIGLAVGQALDVETQARESLGDVLEILRARVGRAGEAADLRRRRSQGIARALLPQHLERPKELVHGFVERGELVALR